MDVIQASRSGGERRGRSGEAAAWSAAEKSRRGPPDPGPSGMARGLQVRGRVRLSERSAPIGPPDPAPGLKGLGDRPDARFKAARRRGCRDTAGRRRRRDAADKDEATARKEANRTVRRSEEEMRGEEREEDERLWRYGRDFEAFFKSSMTGAR